MFGPWASRHAALWISQAKVISLKFHEKLGKYYRSHVCGADDVVAWFSFSLMLIGVVYDYCSFFSVLLGLLHCILNN